MKAKSFRKLDTIQYVLPEQIDLLGGDLQILSGTSYRRERLS